jgi:hypothetical protein
MAKSKKVTIKDIVPRYKIIAPEVKTLLNQLSDTDSYAVVYEIDKFLASKPLLTIAENNCLKKIKEVCQPTVKNAK